MSDGRAALRLFIALDLPADVQRQTVEITQELEQRAGRQAPRWNAPAQRHVTVKFLGSVPRARIPELSALISEAAERRSAIPTSLGEVTAFPNPRRARVVIVRLADPTGALDDLAGEISAKAAELGFEPEARAFVPHVTLARLRMPLDARHWFASLTPPSSPFFFDDLKLYSSQLSPRGSHYEPVFVGRFARVEIDPEVGA
jgi:2'-5' RNA ligase